ncbi:MAG TPA: PIN domain-containing protein [Candidatus Acidoferrales bacterium]|nr:PIN domain-containing protein [Candidatus Acidoferrales bacterium]
MPAVLDTHAAIWYLTDSRKLSPEVYSLIDQAAMAGSPAYISAITLVEVVYLAERERIAKDAIDRFA